MPLREYRCNKCGKVQDELHFGDYPKTSVCEVCGGQAEYRIGAPVFKLAFKYGWDAGAGAYFDSNRQKNNYLASHGLEKVPDGVYDQAFGEKVKE